MEKCQTLRRQKYFTGHLVWWKAIIHRTESKFAGPKNLSGILTNKSQISLFFYICLLLQTLLYCTMHFLHLKSCSQDLCLCCCFGRRNMRCLYMHTTFPWSCTAETILFVQPVTNIIVTCSGLVYNYQDRIVSAHMYVIEHWVRAKVVQFSIAQID